MPRFCTVALPVVLLYLRIGFWSQLDSVFNISEDHWASTLISLISCKYE
jgi:hypothetical protein